MRYILGLLPTLNVDEHWTRGTLTEHVRGQDHLDQARVDRARALATRAGVTCRIDPGDPKGEKGTIYFFRSDTDAPGYPATYSERLELRAAERARLAGGR